MKILTPDDIKKLPKCVYQPFIPCTAEKPPKSGDAESMGKCLACCLVGIQNALVKDQVCGAMLCYDSLLLVLKSMGTELKL